MDVNELLAELDRTKELRPSLFKCELLVEVLMQVSNAADNTLLFMRDRLEGEYLRNQLEYDDLRNIGHYRLSRQKKKDTHSVSFAKPECTITFTFKRKEYTMEDKLLDMVKEDHHMSDEERQYVAMQTIMGELSGKGRSVQENLLGTSARTLDTYALDKVDVITLAPRKIGNWTFPFISSTITETVYQTPE